MEKTLYFVGAGFSKEFGVPLTGELLKCVLKEYENPNHIYLREERASEFSKLLQKFFPGTKSTSPNHLNIPGSISIIDIFSLLDQLIRDVDSTDLIRRDAKRLLHLLDRSLSVVFESFDINELAEWWIKARATIQPEIVFISTNYDLVVEEHINSALVEIGKDPAGPDSLHLYLNLGFDYYHWQTQEFITRPEAPQFTLLKLHGSHNRMACSKCGRIVVHPVHPMSYQKHSCHDDEFNTCHACNIRLEDFLVNPSRVRSELHPSLKDAFNLSFDALANHDHWTFIGYSLPPEDTAIYSLLIRALSNRHERHLVTKITVVQLGFDAKPRYELIFGHDIDYQADGFEAFLQRELSK